MSDVARVAPDAAQAPFVLSIDLGSSSARVLAFDAKARAIDGVLEQIGYHMETTPDGGVTANPDVLVRYVEVALDHCLRKLRSVGLKVDAVAAVGVTTFWHNLMGVDARYQPVTPLYSWAETRPRSILPELEARLDAKAIHQRTGCRLHPSYLPAKLVWLRTHRPEEYGQARYWLSISEYLYLRLFGQRVCSHSMASGTGLYNLAECTWDKTLLAELELDPATLSPLGDLDLPITGLRAEFARDWPELTGIPWVLAIGDGAASNLGCGAVDERNLTLMVGTSGAMRTVYRGELRPIPDGLWCYRIDRQRLIMGGALSNGGEVFNWLRRTFALEDVEAVSHELAGRAPDEHGLTVLPFFAGERSPGWHADATAALVGLRLATTPLDIVQACLEAVGYRFNLIYERLRPLLTATPRILGSGGGLERSAVWTQMMADILGEEVVLSPVAEGSARGAAVIALESLGLDPHEADRGVAQGRAFAVDPARHAAYVKAFARHRALYETLYP